MEKPKKMESEQSNINPQLNENGSVLLTTVIILLLLTLIGVSGINTASTDLQITRNYRIYKENLMLADAAVNRAATDVVNALSENIIGRSWVDDIAGVHLVEDLQAEDNKYFKAGSSYDPVFDPVTNAIVVDEVINDWGSIGDPGDFDPVALAGEPDTEYIAFLQIDEGDKPSERIASAVVIARSQKDGGNVVIEAGLAMN